VRGFCHCRPPFYGLGCLKGGQEREQQQRGVHRAVQRLARQKQRKQPARSRLKIYMYDLPWQVAFQDGYHPGEGPAVCSVLQCGAQRVPGKPPPAGLQNKHQILAAVQIGRVTTPTTSPSGSLPASWQRTRRWVDQLIQPRGASVPCTAQCSPSSAVDQGAGLP
jgi:hypothetical protein